MSKRTCDKGCVVCIYRGAAAEICRERMTPTTFNEAWKEWAMKDDAIMFDRQRMIYAMTAAEFFYNAGRRDDGIGRLRCFLPKSRLVYRMQ